MVGPYMLLMCLYISRLIIASDYDDLFSNLQYVV